MRTLLLVIGSLLPILSVITYIVSILKGQTRPERMTRFLLVVITAVTFAALWVGGDTSGVWLALVSFLQAVLVCLLSFKKGMGGTSRLDFICLALCLGGIGLWMLSDWPWIGLLAAIAADCVAMVPALRKTMRLPHTELALFYALDVVAGVAILLAGHRTAEAMVFPVYIILINLVFVVVIRWPRRSMHPEQEGGV